MNYVDGLGYRSIGSGSTSVHYWGVVTMTAATAVTIHLTFGLEMKINRRLETTASHRRAMSPCLERVKSEAKLYLHV